MPWVHRYDWLQFNLVFSLCFNTLHENTTVKRHYLIDKVVQMATSSKSSVCRARSGKSSTSSASAAHARAKAEAAKVRASYASQEA